MATSIGLLQNLWQFFNPHTCNYSCWKPDEHWSSSYGDIPSDMPILAVSSNNVHLLPLQTLGLLDQMSPKLYTMYWNSCYLLFSNQNSDIAICFTMAVPQTRLADFSNLIGCHGNVRWPMAKRSTVPSSACKALSCGEKIVKIGPVYPKIFNEIRRTTTSKHATQFRLAASPPKPLDRSLPNFYTTLSH